jgi:hypothetical protein
MRCGGVSHSANQAASQLRRTAITR